MIAPGYVERPTERTPLSEYISKIGWRGDLRAKAASYAKLLYTSRRKSRLGLRELSRIVGLSPTYICLLETGRAVSIPSTESLARLAKALSIPVDDLMLAARRLPPEVVERLCEDRDLFNMLRAIIRRRIPAKAVQAALDGIEAGLPAGRKGK